MKEGRANVGEGREGPHLFIGCESSFLIFFCFFQIQMLEIEWTNKIHTHMQTMTDMCSVRFVHSPNALVRTDHVGLNANGNVRTNRSGAQSISLQTGPHKPSRYTTCR